jgi:colanic acid/amylovoran biosynthesis glycosyltransferase
MDKTSGAVMRIAYLINLYPKVSHSFIRREILALERRNVDVTRIALRGWDEELADEQDNLEREQTRFVLQDGAAGLLIATARMLIERPVRLLRAFSLAVRMGLCAERPLSVHLVYVAEACRIMIWLREVGAQHLHAHFGTNSAEIAMLTNVLGGPPWSFTVHGPDEFNNPYLIGLAEKIRRCAFVVAISSFGRSQLYRLVEYRYWSKVHVVHCGLESAFHAVPAQPEGAGPRFVCVGRLSEQKGQLLLVEAARRLVELGVKFDLLIAGDGELRAEIETFICRHKLQDRVRISGWISSAEVRKEILAARALVLPSFAEGLPVSIMEAMSLRRPVISTFVAGVPELVHPGEHGWLVPAGDVEALVEAMQACLAAPADMLKRMGDAARERVLERHNVDTAAAQLINLFGGPSNAM